MKDMSEWVEVADKDEITEGEGIMVHGPEDNHIALFQIEGELYAINHVCPHQGGPLADGIMVDDKVVACPWHGWEFDITTGESPSHEANVDTYKVKQENGKILVGGLKKEGSCCGGKCGGKS